MAEVISATVRSFWLRVRAKIELDSFLSEAASRITEHYPFEIAGIRFSLQTHSAHGPIPPFEVKTSQWQLNACHDPKREIAAMMNGTYSIDAASDQESYFVFDLTGSEEAFNHDCTLMMMFYD